MTTEEEIIADVQDAARAFKTGEVKTASERTEARHAEQRLKAAMANVKASEEVDYKGTVNPPTERTEATMDDLEDLQRFLTLDLDKEVILITDKVEFVEDTEFCLTNSQNSNGNSYKVEIIDHAGKILSVTAWGLWNQLKVGYKTMGKFKNTTFKIKKVDRGVYQVEYKKGEIWTRVSL